MILGLEELHNKDIICKFIITIQILIIKFSMIDRDLKPENIVINYGK